jgi:hypothetical protein
VQPTDELIDDQVIHNRSTHQDESEEPWSDERLEPAAGDLLDPQRSVGDHSQFVVPAAARPGVQGWLRTRPIWFWFAVGVGWIVAAAILLLVHRQEPSRGDVEWQNIRKAYDQMQTEREARAAAKNPAKDASATKDSK